MLYLGLRVKNCSLYVCYILEQNLHFKFYSNWNNNEKLLNVSTVNRLNIGLYKVKNWNKLKQLLLIKKRTTVTSVNTITQLTTKDIFKHTKREIHR